jgi:hypothetical protein
VTRDDERKNTMSTRPSRSEAVIAMAPVRTAQAAPDAESEPLRYARHDIATAIGTA